MAYALHPMFLPQQMMLTSIQMMQTFVTTYMAASKRLMQKGSEQAQDLSDTAMKTAEEVNWQGQEALKSMTEDGKSALQY